MDKKKRLVMKKYRKNKARLKRKRQELAVKFVKTTDSPQVVEEKLVPEKETKKAKPKAKPKAKATKSTTAKKKAKPKTKAASKTKSSAKKKEQ
jgi:large subunit ribosomal protein L21